MRDPVKSAIEKLLQLWERIVLLHQRFKANPSLQCAWDITKLVIQLLILFFKVYIQFR